MNYVLQRHENLKNSERGKIKVIKIGKPGVDFSLSAVRKGLFRLVEQRMNVFFISLIEATIKHFRDEQEPPTVFGELVNSNRVLQTEADWSISNLNVHAVSFDRESSREEEKGFHLSITKRHRRDLGKVVDFMAV